MKKITTLNICSVAIVSSLVASSLQEENKMIANTREPVARTISAIQRADYEGDRAALRSLCDGLMPFVDSDVAPQVRYWRGFAMWRRAINGFNDPVDPKELEEDLNHAVDEFKHVTEKDSVFGDARIGMISCLSLIGFLHKADPARVQELLVQLRPLILEAKKVAANNPRLNWVLGQNTFVAPPERGGGQDKAIEMYKHSLELIRRSKPVKDALEPSWGEPELLMSLAYSYLYHTPPDPSAAEDYAQSALKIVPHWHYVRDVLMPQIVDAKAKYKR